MRGRRLPAGGRDRAGEEAAMGDGDRREEGEGLSPRRRIDAACDRFERAWLAGRMPRIEDVLAEWPGPDRPELLRELLAVELELRRGLGERLEPREYHARFPAYAGLVDAVFEASPAPEGRS